MSLRLRLTLTYSVLMALIIALMGLVLYATSAQSLGAEMDRRLQVRADQVAALILPRYRVITSADLHNLDMRPISSADAPGTFVQVMDRDGQIVASSESLSGAHLPVDSTIFSAALKGQRETEDVGDFGGMPVRLVAMPIDAGVIGAPVVGVLVVGQSRQPLIDLMNDLGRLLLIYGGAAVLVSGVVGWLVAMQGLSPLKRFSAQAATIAAKRDFARRLEPASSRDEVGQLAQTINHLLYTVEETLQIHREFVADTSHELRNPLFALRTNLELIDRLHDADEREECIREAQQQVARLSRLVADLLVLAQVEQGLVVEKHPVELEPLVRRVVREAQRRAAGVAVVLDHAEPLVMMGDDGRIAQVVTNLVDNAMKYTPATGIVTVRLDRQDDWAKITVADTGEGIPAEHLPHIFKRFYRVQKSGPRAVGGAGLGLSIVKRLTEMQGGRVEVESKLGVGSKFIVLLPLRSEAVPDAEVLPTASGIEADRGPKDAAPPLPKSPAGGRRGATAAGRKC